MYHRNPDILGYFLVFLVSLAFQLVFSERGSHLGPGGTRIDITGLYQTTPAGSTIAHNRCGCADMTAGFPFE